MFIAVGAVLAFAVSAQVAGINIQTVGVILIVVGGIGLAIAMATLAGYSPWASTRGAAPLSPPNAGTPANAAPTANVTAPVIVNPPASPAPPRV
jgi:hypothetical protein